MAEKRDIKYLNKDFSSLRAKLIDYSKTYFPNTYNDFTEASPGMMFMEMAAYVGDVLSFYMDNQIQENFVQYAREENNLYTLAYMLGYKPKVTTAATVAMSIYQTVPAFTTGNYLPDFSYALQIPENTQITYNADPSVKFLTTQKVDFTFSSSLDPTEISVYSVSGANPSKYLLKKTVPAISANINTLTLTVSAPQEFYTVNIEANDIIGILDIFDSNGDQWYEVPYLAEELVYKSIRNTNPNDPNFYLDTDAAYLLKTEKVAKRFVTRFTSANNLQVQFGSGTSNDSTEEIIPNPDNVGLGLPYEQDKLTTAYSPTNFIFTNTYGIAPSNTTLTIRYLTGGGVAANVPALTLNTLEKSNVTFVSNNVDNGSNLANDTIYSPSFGLNCINEVAATGGSDGDTVAELRLNSLSSYSTQLRNVTQDDYLVRALSLPSQYGSLAKVYAEKSKLSNNNNEAILDLYVLSYDINKNLRTASAALKQNLQTYLYQYKMIGDSINIKDAFIINIGVDFNIIVLPNYNNNQVLVKCIEFIKGYFNIDRWQINQPILLNDLYIGLDNIDGVQTVKSVSITNKTGTNYSEYAYDTSGATLNNVVYPSLDPMIFEVKYPATDIQGRVVSL